MTSSQCYCFLLLLLLYPVSIKAFDEDEEKVWDRIFRRLSSQLPVLVEDQLIDLLKYHRYDKMLSKGHKSEIERLNEGLHHMKGVMNQLNRRLRSVENSNEALRREFKKSEAHTHMLEGELNELSTMVKDIERNFSKDDKGKCFCNPDTNAEERLTTRSTITNLRPKFSSMLAISADEPDFVKIDLRSRKVKQLKSHMEGRVTATTYDPKSNCVIWSKVKSGLFNGNGGSKIYSAPLDSLGEEMQIHSSGASALTVDTTKNWLFFATPRPRKSISRIRPTGGDYSQIHQMGEFSDLHDIVVDPQKKLIYTCDGDNLIEVDYKGTQKKILMKGGFVVALAFGAQNSELYYFSYDNLKKRNMKTGKEVVVKSNLDMIPRDLTYDDGKLYYGGFFQRTVRVLDLKTSAIYDIWSLEGTSISLCLVP